MIAGVGLAGGPWEMESFQVVWWEQMKQEASEAWEGQGATSQGEEGEWLEGEWLGAPLGGFLVQEMKDGCLGDRGLSS